MIQTLEGDIIELWTMDPNGSTPGLSCGMKACGSRITVHDMQRALCHIPGKIWLPLLKTSELCQNLAELETEVWRPLLHLKLQY